MTFSLVARCAKTGMFGVAISSSSPAVGARCSHARAGVGAVASQNVTDPRLGPLALDLMQGGKSAAEAIAAVREQAQHIIENHPNNVKPLIQRWLSGRSVYASV